MRLFCLSLLLCFGLASAIEAQIPPSAKQQASQLSEKAQNLYAKKDFSTALEAWQKAYELVQDPRLLYNLSLCYKGLGEYEKSEELLNEWILKTHQSKSVQTMYEVERETLASMVALQAEAKRVKKKKTLLWTSAGIGSAGLIGTALFFLLKPPPDPGFLGSFEGPAK